MIWALWLAACHGGEDTGPFLDTGWFVDDTGCDATIVETFPADGQSDWYWRSPPTLRTTTTDATVIAGRVLDARGVEVATTPTWVGTQLRLDLAAPLAPDAAYVLEVADCAGTRPIAFRTSRYGEPLTLGPTDLLGKTFVFDLAAARWDEPAGFGTVLALYFTTPVLVGVEYADDAHLDLLGGQGNTDNQGRVVQLTGEPTWDFPIGDFALSPYFEARSPLVTITFDGVEVPVHDFTLSATFSADATSLGGGLVSGLGDTRNMGELVGSAGNERAICSVAATMGVACGPCPDGETYCLRMSARDAAGTLVPGLHMRRIE